MFVTVCPVLMPLMKFRKVRLLERINRELKRIDRELFTKIILVVLYY